MWDLIAFVDVALFHWNLEETRSCICVICIQKRKRVFTESTFNRPCLAKHIFQFPHRSFISHTSFLLTYQLKFLLFTCPIKNFHFPLHKFHFPLHKTLSFSLYLSHSLSHSLSLTHTHTHTHTHKTLLAPTSKAQPSVDVPSRAKHWQGRAQPSPIMTSMTPSPAINSSPPIPISSLSLTTRSFLPLSPYHPNTHSFFLTIPIPIPILILLSKLFIWFFVLIIVKFWVWIWILNI